jgi:hypothetical protein
VRVHVERHGRLGMPSALRELPRGNARLMPEREPAVPEVVRRVVRDLRETARAIMDAAPAAFDTSGTRA